MQREHATGDLSRLTHRVISGTMITESNSEAAEQAAFDAARASTIRGCLERYIKAEGAETADEVRAAELRFNALDLLGAPTLHQLAARAIESARGPRIVNETRFPATIWTGGASDTYNGRAFLGGFHDFARLLEERAKHLAPKRCGWVVEPTTTIDGRRTNACTTSVHALFLDADGTGSWNALLYELNRLDYAYIAYESGGHTPAVPKWRIVLPLARPHNTTTDGSREAWKDIYHHARVTFGAIAHLSGCGFDPTVDPPAIPWFLTERRQPADPPRNIVWRTGYALDLIALAVALPPPAEKGTRLAGRGPSQVEVQKLDDDRLETIVSALCVPVAEIPNTRRILYQALSGALLDRGIDDDDLITIIDEVSSRCPGDDPTKHREHLHGARTTIRRRGGGDWDGGSRYYNIGTLQEQWPDVAETLDEVLPNPSDENFRQFALSLIDTSDAPAVIPSDAPAGPQVRTATSRSTGPSPIAKKRKRKLTTIGQLLSPIAARLRHFKDEKRRLEGLLLTKLLDGEPLQGERSTDAEIDTLVAHAMRAVGYHLPQATWQEILDFASPSLLRMDFTQSSSRVTAAEDAFRKGQKGKNKKQKKKSAEIAEQRAQAKLFFAVAADGKRP